MEKDILIVLGNGFSIDLVKYLKLDAEIDLINLFNNGDKVIWPGSGEPGFLSQYHCPALWELGARANSERVEANKLIEDIITCANVSASSSSPTINTESNNVYIRAYHELVEYLRYLFIYYNSKIEFDESKLKEWGWAKLLLALNKNTEIQSVCIITYNYDILLERVLHVLGIDFSVEGFYSKEAKIKILKPHGSISFRSNKRRDSISYSIKYNRDSLGGTIEELLVDEEVGFDVISTTNTMIPPAGEAGRYKLAWSTTLKNCVSNAVEKLSDGDDVFFAGLSYCNVDRQELDEIITSLDSNVNIKVINPDTKNTFCAVISSVFSNYIHYTTSDVLGGIYND